MEILGSLNSRSIVSIVDHVNGLPPGVIERNGEASAESALETGLQGIVMAGANGAEFLRKTNSAESRVERLAWITCSDHLASINIEVFGEHPGLARRHVTHLAGETVFEFFLKGEVPRLNVAALQLLRQAREPDVARDVNNAIPQVRRG